MTKPSTFSAWQEANQVRRETAIREYLEYLKTTRVRFDYVTDLADMVAKHLSELEGEPCAKSTLLRNPRYKAPLLSYQFHQLNGGTGQIRLKDVKDESAKALVLTADLKAGNLAREVERLNIYAKALEAELADLRRAPAPTSSTKVPASVEAAQVTEFQIKFVRTCQAFTALLSYLNVALEADSTNLRILDRSKRRNNVIVEEHLAGPYFEWLATTSQGSAS